MRLEEAIYTFSCRHSLQPPPHIEHRHANIDIISYREAKHQEYPTDVAWRWRSEGNLLWISGSEMQTCVLAAPLGRPPGQACEGRMQHRDTAPVCVLDPTHLPSHRRNTQACVLMSRVISSGDTSRLSLSLSLPLPQSLSLTLYLSPSLSLRL